MAVDLKNVTDVDAEPGTLPKTMAAWVIRQEREGEPTDAFQIEEIEVPEPGALEVVVRVMAAGVNYNNVWAAMGKPVSVFRYHPDEDHHIGGSDASGVVWKTGPGVTKWKPGDEVIIHCNQASYEDPEVHGLDPMAAPSQKIWGYETSWGSFAQFTKVQAQQLIRKPENLTWEEAASYGLTYFTAYRMLITRCNIQAGDRVLIWGAAGGLGVFATQLCNLAGALSCGVVSSAEKGALLEQIGITGWIDRNEHAGMMRKGGEAGDEEKARFKASRAFGKAVKEVLGGDPDIVFEHVGQATFPTSVLVVKPFGKVVICAGDDRLQPRLRRPLPVDAAEGDPRVALRERLGVHEGQRAHGVGRDPPGAVAHDGVRRRRRGAPDHEGEQAPREDRDPRRRRGHGPGQDRRGPGRDLRGGRCLMKPEETVVFILWHANPFRGDKFEDAWRPHAQAALDYGASAWAFFRSKDDPLDFIQLASFESKTDFERYWYSEEMAEARAESSGLYQVPILPQWLRVVDAGELSSLPQA